MNVNNVSLAAVGVKMSQFPAELRPEIAFVGKSNVGKSSLINTMINRKRLARTSSTPGKTRTINFYDIEGKIYFVDLPGYGYAKAPKTEIQKWGAMIEEYLLRRVQLKSIILLVDIRHEPSENDIIMYEWLKHYNYEIVIVATKADKLKRSQIQKHMSVLIKAFNLSKDDLIFPFSSESRVGKDTLWDFIDKTTGIIAE